MVDEKIAKKLWNDVFGYVEWAQDCFGTWMNKNAWSSEEVMMYWPGTNEKYDFSWNVDHIRPKSDFKNEEDAHFFNNYEPMQRQNNFMKADNYPHFEIDGKKYKVFKQKDYYGYGIIDVDQNIVVDWKSTQKRYYESK